MPEEMMKVLNVTIDEGVHRRLKTACAERAISIRDFVRMAIAEKLKRDAAAREQPLKLVQVHCAKCGAATTTDNPARKALCISCEERSRAAQSDF